MPYRAMPGRFAGLPSDLRRSTISSARSIPTARSTSCLTGRRQPRAAIPPIIRRVDLEEARAFVRQHHRAILATVRADGGAQLSPVLAGIDDEGFVEISSNEGKAKVRNLERDPRATLLVMTEKFFERRWIQIDGTATVVPLPAAADALIAYEHRMAGDA